MTLPNNHIHYISKLRCTININSIATHLLEGIAATPDPDSTLAKLSLVSDSLGGKGVLWELFSFHPPSLQLYIRLCSAANYLSGLLVSNPGMIDELMDSLVMNRLPTRDWLEQTLAELCHGAEDPFPILQSFKNSQHVSIGVRDVLGKEDIRDTHRALSDVAEVCLRQVAAAEYQKLSQKYGEPTIGTGADARPCELIILAMGKLGGREPNYHSDLDVVFLYEAEGATIPPKHSKATSNQHFFGQLAQRIIKVVGQLSTAGRLFEIDTRLRPTGKNGVLAVSLAELQKYFDDGRGKLWERQALCKARPCYCSPAAGEAAMQTVRGVIAGPPWKGKYAKEIYAMRSQLEETASEANLKRGPGGTMDIEFAVQMLQMKYAAAAPSVLTPGTLEAIEALGEENLLSTEDRASLAANYRFLRNVEARIRLMNTSARHDLPSTEAELEKLAFLLEYESPDRLLQAVKRHRTDTRRCYEQIFQAQF